MASTLFNPLATASTNGSEPRIHDKGDGTSYNFVGRSYGVGASVGLANISSPVLSPCSGYTYNESGYQTSVSCVFNHSSALILELSVPKQDVAVPNLYMATDAPTGGTFYVVTSFNGNSSIVAFGLGDLYSNIVSITAGTEYTRLDQIQCTAQFSPSAFRITGNTTSQINVELLGPGQDIDPSAPASPNGHGRLQQNVIWEIIRLSQQSLNLYSSNIGESFKANVERTLSQSWDEASDDNVLAAAATSFEAMIDDILLAFASTQYTLGPQGSQRLIPATMTADAIVIGASNGIYGTFVFNMLLLGIWIAERVRTRFWKNTPAWDFLSVEDLVIATSRGGKAISEAFASLTEKPPAGFGIQRTRLFKWLPRFTTQAGDALARATNDASIKPNAMGQGHTRKPSAAEESE